MTGTSALTNSTQILLPQLEAATWKFIQGAVKSVDSHIQTRPTKRDTMAIGGGGVGTQTDVTPSGAIGSGRARTRRCEEELSFGASAFFWRVGGACRVVLSNVQQDLRVFSRDR